MKRKLTVLLLLVSLLTGSVGVRNVYADDISEEDYTEVMSVEQEETSTDETGEEGLPGDEVEIDVEVETEQTQQSQQEIPETEEEIPLSEEIVSDDRFVIPEGFVLRESDIEGKRLILESGVLDIFDEMVEGKDYAAKELIFLADDAQYVQQVADIYHSDVVSFADGIAVIRITDDLTVREVMEACLDLDQGFPLVEPNYIFYEEPVMIESQDEISQAKDTNSLPKVNDWNGWVNEVFTDPDPYLSTPSSYQYQWQHEMIHTYAGWNATMGDRNIKVAVIDQSINQNHIDLRDNVIRIEVVNGLATCYGSGHGNHVAGIIAAAADNGYGGAGVAPNVSIIGINVFTAYTEGDEEYYGANTSDIIAGINRAVSRGANIINMSIGGYEYNYYYDITIQNAIDVGVTVVAAAGNDGTEIKNYPAAFDNVIAVAAVTRDGSRASYSNFGSWVTISAPGSFIFSSISESEGENYRFDQMSGTSMATPVVTGAIALYMSKVGPISPKEVLNILKQSVNKCPSPKMGLGIIDVEKMFQKSNDLPVIQVYDRYGYEITDLRNPVPEGAYIDIYNPAAGDKDRIIYTADGKNPSIKDGQIVNGEVYTSGNRIYIDEFQKGKTIKINATIVNSLGVMGKVKSLSIKTPAVTVQNVKIKTVTLDKKKITLNYHDGFGDTDSLYVNSLINVNNASVDIDYVEHKWTSSNTKVATVDEYGNVTAVSAGTARITLAILDGSNKTAVCDVTVVQLIDELKIEGLSGMAAGSSTTFKVSVLPSNAKNKKVEWQIMYDKVGATINSANGKVTVPKTAVAGSYFWIAAVAQDGSNEMAMKRIDVVDKATAVSITTNNPRAIFNKNNVLTGLTLFTVDINDYLNMYEDNTAVLTAYVTGNNIPPLWTSSNTKVATVDQNGRVTAVSAGKAVITCTANDGSGKKATVNVTVTVPISSLFIDLGSNTTLAEGKKLDLSKKVSFGAQYGKPTTKKAEWYLQSVICYDEYDYEYYPDQNVINKNITVSKTGALTVKANALTNMYPYAEYAEVYVYAISTDGTGYYDYATIRINRPVAGINVDVSDGYCWVDDAVVNYIYCDQLVEFEIKSSNSNVAAAGTPVLVAKNYTFYGKDGKWHNGYVYEVLIGAYKSGNVTFTAKTLDGSNKSITFKMRVY